MDEQQFRDRLRASTPMVRAAPTGAIVRRGRRRVLATRVAAGVLVTIAGVAAIGVASAWSTADLPVVDAAPSSRESTAPSTARSETGTASPSEVASATATAATSVTEADTGSPTTATEAVTEVVTEASTTLPRQRTDLVHGGQAIALYVAVADANTDAGRLQQAQATAGTLGYAAGHGDLGCDAGAAEALGLDPGPDTHWMAVALYFSTRVDAEAVAAAFQEAGHPVAGIADVTTYCLD